MRGGAAASSEPAIRPPSLHANALVPEPRGHRCPLAPIVARSRRRNTRPDERGSPANARERRFGGLGGNRTPVQGFSESFCIAASAPRPLARRGERLRAKVLCVATPPRGPTAARAAEGPHALALLIQEPRRARKTRESGGEGLLSASDSPSHLTAGAGLTMFPPGRRPGPGAFRRGRAGSSADLQG